MEQEITLDLLEMLQAIRKRLWIIILVTVVAVGISGAYSFYFVTPVYEARTSIIIGKEPEGQTERIQYNDVMMYQKLVKTYGEIAKSRLVAEKTIQRMNKSIEPEKLLKTITVTPQPDTQIMFIKVKSPIPGDAMDTVNTLAECFIDESLRLYPTGNVQIMDRATLPESPVSPNKKLNIAIAFFLGVMLSLGIIFLIEYMDNTIKTELDIQRYLDIPIIGVIPQNREKL